MKRYFQLHNHIDKRGESQILLYVNINSEKLRIPLAIKVPAKQWNNEKKKKFYFM